MTALWIVWTVVFGLFSTAVFYCLYLFIIESLRSLPVDYIEYLGGEVEFEDMKWPPTYGVPSEDTYEIPETPGAFKF